MSSFFDFSSLVNVKDLQQNKSIHYETIVPKQTVTPNEPGTLPEKKITKPVNNGDNVEVSASLFSFDAISSLFADMTFQTPSQQEAIENIVQKSEQQSIAVVPVAADDEFGEPIKELWNLRHRKPYKLYPYQLDTIKFILNREKKENEVHGIRGTMASIFMGAGKTLISLTVIVADILRRVSIQKSRPAPTLILCPKSLLQNWKEEVLKFFGNDIRVLTYFRDLIQPKCLFDRITADEFGSYHIILSTYETITLQAKYLGLIKSNKKKDNISLEVGPALLFSRFSFTRVICDESHIFANPKSQMFLALLHLQSPKKLNLTGTCIRNSSVDLYVQLRFLGFNVFKDTRKWSDKVYEDLQLKQVVLSLNMKDAKLELPELHEIDVDCILDQTEQALYDKYTQLTSVLYQKFKKGSSGASTFGLILKAMIRWRQICISPRLLPPEETKDLFLPQLSSKFKKLKEILEDKIPPNKKVIIFSNWSKPLKLCLEWLPLGKAILVDGSLNSKKRSFWFEKFKTDPEILYLLMTFKVGNVGLNLTVAQYVVFTDSWWSPTHFDQAAKRVHRIGQTEECYIYNLIVPNSIESKIIEVCYKKTKLAKRYFDPEALEGENTNSEGQMMNVLDAYFQTNKLT